MNLTSESTKDTEDNSDRLQQPQRMSASQKYRDKNPMTNGYSSSSDDDQSVEAKPTNRKDKAKALKHPALLDDDDVDDQSSVTSTPSEPIPYIQLPTEWHRKKDECDEVERLARKRRCEEIIRLSAKIVAEAKRKASIRPLKWAEPTFDPSSNSNTSSAHIDSQQTFSEKQEGRQQDARNNMCFPGRNPTPEEVQNFVDFANTMIPTGKRRRRSNESDE
jgi:hypothetical protein